MHGRCAMARETVAARMSEGNHHRQPGASRELCMTTHPRLIQGRFLRFCPHLPNLNTTGCTRPNIDDS